MKLIASIVFVYMMAALTWWTILLLRQNEMIFALNNQQMPFLNGADALKLYTKQKNMIYAEGLVIGLSLMMGMLFIYRVFKKEIINLKSQNNFLLAFSHELKSPLTSINLSLDTLKKRSLPQETQKEICDIAINESKRLENLINSILMVVKIDNFTMHFESLDLRKILKDIVEVCNSTNEQKVHVKLDIEDDDFHFNADKMAIQSIFINLIENAVKYGDGKEVFVKLAKREEMIIFEVADMGKGIPNNEKNKIFNRFYRRGDEATRTAKGTGLGLYIVKKLTDLHKANIIVEDNKPTGTIFKVSFQKKID